MSNVYASISDFGLRFDARQIGMLGNDVNSNTASSTIVQAALDDSASELDAIIRGRIRIPLTSPPSVLTKWVCIKAAEALYRRRSDKPKGLADDLRWCEQWTKDFSAGLISLGVDMKLITPAEQTIDEEVAVGRAGLTSAL